MTSQSDSNGAAEAPLAAPAQLADATSVARLPLRHKAVRIGVMILGALGVILAVNQQFLLNIFGFQNSTA